jgi:hypothetical protein
VATEAMELAAVTMVAAAAVVVTERITATRQRR